MPSHGPHIDTLLMDEDLGIFVGTRQLALVVNGNELPWRETAIKIVDVRGRVLKTSLQTLPRVRRRLSHWVVATGLL